MLGSACVDGRESTRHVMLTICKSKDQLSTIISSGTYKVVTFCSGQTSNIPRLGTDVKDDGCLKPWDLNDVTEPLIQKLKFIPTTKCVPSLYTSSFTPCRLLKHTINRQDRNHMHITHRVYLMARWPPSTVLHD